MCEEYFRLTKKRGAGQNGNVLFLILIAVALFAALAVVVTQSSRGSGSTMSDEVARLAASRILNYGVALQTAVMKITTSSCTHAQISFERSPFNGTDTNYVNTRSPTNFRCHVFHPEGGAVSSQDPDKEFFKNTPTLTKFKGVYTITGRDCISGIGTGGGYDQCWNNGDNSDTELLLTLVDVRDEICLAVNRMHRIDRIQTMPASRGNFFDSNDAGASFRGIFGYSATDSGHVYVSDSNGKNMFCFRDGTAATNILYYVILAR